MNIDVKIVFSETYQNGENSSPENLGTIPAGKTMQMRGIILGGIGLDQRVVLQAEDLSGTNIWQKTWSGTDFVKLKDNGWEIIVSKQTGN